MRPYILCSLIALFLQNSAFSQKVSFETTVNLFSLDSRHLEQSQPMHPYVSDSGFVNFIGRSGDQNLLFTQNSKGDFQKDTIFKNEGIYNFIVDYLDLDNDGDKDIITDQNLFQVNGEKLEKHFPAIFQTEYLGVADFNGDSLVDIIVKRNIIADDDSIYIYKNLGNFQFEYSKIESAARGYQTCSVGDIDNNGTLDFACTISSSNKLKNPVCFYFNDGKGNFTVKYPDLYSRDLETINLELTDLDGDKDLDIIMVGYGMVFFENTDNFTTLKEFTFPFEFGVFNPTFFENPVIIKAADLNKDGVKDLVILSEVQNSRTISVASGKGNFSYNFPEVAGTFKSEYQFGSSSGTDANRLINIIDLNKDGLADITFTSGFEKKQIVMLNKSSISTANQEYNSTQNLFFEIYPTIIQSELTINSHVDHASLLIYNSVGKLMNKINVKSGQNIMNFEYLNAGMYVISGMDNAGNRQNMKVIKID